jgi:hypothetical protein
LNVWFSVCCVFLNHIIFVVILFFT